MPTYSIQGSTDPFVHVELAEGEKIMAERDSMAMMSDTIDLSGKARGGALKSLARAVTTGESFFMQEIVASRGSGTVMLSPQFPGEVRPIELQGEEWMLNHGAFLAGDESLSIETVRQKSVGMAVFGGSGGFFQLKVSGTGTMVVATIGAIREITVEPGQEVIVDNGHAVAWPANIEASIGLATKPGGGLLSKAVGSAKTGEGVIIRFKGGNTGGRVLVSSRSRSAFISWMSEQLPSS
jgi:uncharacterized protein (TIGR00266 family)